MPTKNLCRTRTVVTASAAAVAGALALGTVAASATPLPAGPSASVEVAVSAPRQLAFGLTTDQRVVTFDLARPSFVSRTARVSGLPTGSTIVGIDERPKTGALYAVIKGADGAASIYIVDSVTGTATLEAALVAIGTTTPIMLTGTLFGVDFNPAADALRITGDDGQNLRALPSDRVVATVSRVKGDTFTDGMLSYSPVGSDPRPAATGITASAYTNSVATTGGPTALHNIDTLNGDLTLQAPPNDGTQVKVADLALNGRSVQGFDILTGGDGDLGYVAVSSPPSAARRLADKIRTRLGIQLPARAVPTELHTIDLATGALTRLGPVGGRTLVDIAVDTPGAPPA